VGRRFEPVWAHTPKSEPKRLENEIQIFRVILANLTSKGKAFWFASLAVGLCASVLEVASAATFSLLTSVLFGGRKSNLGILAGILPFAITQVVLIASLSVIFLSKLVFQWIELNLKTKSAEEFYTSIFQKKAFQSQTEIQQSRAPVTSLANRIHILTHNIYYPAGLIISELMIMMFLVPFVIYISPKASLLVFGTTIVLSIPALTYARKKITYLINLRSQFDTSIDYEVYLDFRSFYDQGRIRTNAGKLRSQIHNVSEIDRKIVKLGSYSRLAIELSFIFSVILTFTFIDELVAAESRIQFFAVLAYSFFRVIPAFTRVVGARNQLASHQSEFLQIASIEVPAENYESAKPPVTFETSLTFMPFGTTQSDRSYEMNFKSGDFVLVRGETGVGKTTLLKAIGGLRKVDFEVIADNIKILEPDSWKPSVALVSQSPFLYGQNLIEMITGEGSSKGINLELYSESLRISCLETWSEGQPRNLTNENVSGGERKQIALARAIYSQPQILLLDEVTAGMDQKLAEQIISNLRICAHFKLIVLASHDLLREENFDQVINLK
jgi:ABC-type bacteriocin/lantibiotic exporter with double-glycine peptidase domain